MIMSQSTLRRPRDWKHQSEPLTDKRILLSGGTTGIGRAILRMLAAEGAKVVTYGRHEQELNDALASLQGLPGKVSGLTADQSRVEDLQRVFEMADRSLKGIDVLINCAALGGGSIVEADLESMRYIVETNLLGYMTCCKLAVERMGEAGGHIVNIGSMSADVREAESDVYVATKAGIQGFSESLRKVINDKGIKVSLIEPGQTGTDMQPSTPQQQRQEQTQLETLTAEDIAECVYYCLTQPRGCEVVEVKIKPLRQII